MDVGYGLQQREEPLRAIIILSDIRLFQEIRIQIMYSYPDPFLYLKSYPFYYKIICIC